MKNTETTSQKRCFRDFYVQFRLGISPIRVHRMRYRKDVVPSQLLCPVCENEIEDESHVIFRCNAYERFRKEVNIIASTSTTQDTFIALSRVMAADDEESVIQLSRFLYRVCYSAFTLSVQSLLFSFHAFCTESSTCEIELYQVNE